MHFQLHTRVTPLAHLILQDLVRIASNWTVLIQLLCSLLLRTYVLPDWPTYFPQHSLSVLLNIKCILFFGFIRVCG